jgi:toxin YoeB
MSFPPAPSKSYVPSWALEKGKPPGKAPRAAVFHPEFRKDLQFWVKTDRKLALRALEIVEAVLRDPFTGIGKPEPLRYLLQGAWSRRLTQEHRIIYAVFEDRVDFLQARYHY